MSKKHSKDAQSKVGENKTCKVGGEESSLGGDTTVNMVSGREPIYGGYHKVL